jgi:adenylosuccinate synthase
MLEVIDGHFYTEKIINPRQPIVFEGAQGLELDEELGVFPHVTRSITGLLGAYRAAEEMGLAEPIQPVYVTRSYKTRHGAGPLAHEGVRFTDRKLVDKTNTTGLWQGAFRYAPLDLRVLKTYIEKDLARVDTRNVQFPLLAVTHLDEVEDGIMIIDLEGNQVWVDSQELVRELSKVARVGFASYGERASDVV